MIALGSAGAVIKTEGEAAAAATERQGAAAVAINQIPLRIRKS
jgi:hypothetical protein